MNPQKTIYEPPAGSPPGSGKGRAIRLVLLLLVIAALLLLNFAARRTFSLHLRPVIITPAMDLMREQDFSYRKVLRYWLAELDQKLHPGRDRQKVIALTFDGGPAPIYTPLILDALERSRVPATFFLFGADAQQFPQLTIRIRSGGAPAGQLYLFRPRAGHGGHLRAGRGA